MSAEPELTEKQLRDRVDHVVNWYFKGKTFGFRFKSNIVGAEFKVREVIDDRYNPVFTLAGSMRVFIPKGAKVGEIQRQKGWSQTLIPVQLADGTSSDVWIDDESLLSNLPSLPEVVREYRGFHPDTEGYAHTMTLALAVSGYEVIEARR